MQDSDAQHEYVSDIQHEEFQGFTRLIQELNSHVPVAYDYDYLPAAHGLHIPVRKGRKQRNYDFVQQIAQLLTRQSELAPAVLTTQSKTKATPTGEAADGIKPIGWFHILIAASPRHCPQANQSKTGSSTGGRLHLRAKTSLETLDTSHGVIPAVMKFHRETSTTISFDKHVGWTHNFLQNCHATDLKPERYAQLRQEYKNYLYLSSYPKMLARLTWAVRHSHFFQLLTADAESFENSAFDHNDIPATLQMVLPTPKQANFIKLYYPHVCKYTGSAMTDEGMAKEAETRSRSPLYDRIGRRFFHSMMNTAVMTAAHVLLNLSETVEWVRRRGWKPEDLGNVQRVVRNAQSGMFNLCSFIWHFGKVPFGPRSDAHDLLSLHVSWLAGMAHVKRRVQQLKFRVSEPVYGLQRVLSACGRSESEEGSNQEHQEINDEVDLLIGDFHSTPGFHSPGYASGVLRILEIWCLHEQSFQAICPVSQADRSPARSFHIRNASVSVLDIELRSSGKRMSLERCLQKVLETHPYLEAHAAAIRSRLVQRTVAEQEKEKFLHATNQAGTLHSESILLTAVHLIKSRIAGRIPTGDDRRWLAHQKFFGFELPLLHSLRNPISMLVVSNRCSPACEKLFEMMTEEGMFVLNPAKPSVHSRCAAMVLPSYMHKKHVGRLLTNVKQEAFKRAKSLVELIDKEKKAKKFSFDAPEPGDRMEAPSGDVDELEGDVREQVVNFFMSDC